MPLVTFAFQLTFASIDVKTINTSLIKQEVIYVNPRHFPLAIGVILLFLEKFTLVVYNISKVNFT